MYDFIDNPKSREITHSPLALLLTYLCQFVADNAAVELETLARCSTIEVTSCRDNSGRKSSHWLGTLSSTTYVVCTGGHEQPGSKPRS